MSGEDPTQPIRILLIEDDPGDADLLREMLAGEEGSGFQLEHVDRLHKGLESLARGGVDVVLLDLTLPDSRGPATAARIHAEVPTVPLVILTALNDDASALEAVRKGAQDYLIKGQVNGMMLSRVIRYAIERQHAEEQLRSAYAQLKTTQEELIQAEKLAALGRFASGVAHEVKNPLGIILGGIEFLQGNLKESGEGIRVALDKMKEATLRADQILQGLLQFARPVRPQKERVQVRLLLEETLSLLRLKTVLLAGVKVEVQCEEDLQVEVERNPIEQVLFNLLLNAVEAMPQGGTLTLRAYGTNHPGGGPRGSSCVFEIADTGEGISHEDSARLFEPFFTTKRDQKGVGLGLFVSQMIVKNHGGELTIESRSGQGTVARVILPMRIEREVPE